MGYYPMTRESGNQHRLVASRDAWRFVETDPVAFRATDVNCAARVMHIEGAPIDMPVFKEKVAACRHLPVAGIGMVGAGHRNVGVAIAPFDSTFIGRDTP